jgi:ABC-2 type transport system ATP-binding protein
MKKKLAITAVLLQKNEYFIFDEPFNGIDLESSIIFSAILKKLKDLGKTVIISSHIFSTLKDSCDYIYKIEEGTLSPPFAKESFDELEDEMKQKILIKDIGKIL